MRYSLFLSVCVLLLSGCGTTQSTTKLPEQSLRATPIQPRLAVSKPPASPQNYGYVKQYVVGPVQDSQNPQTFTTTNVDVVMEEPSYRVVSGTSIPSPAKSDLVAAELGRELMYVRSERAAIAGVMNEMVEQNKEIMQNNMETSALVIQWEALLKVLNEKIKKAEAQLATLTNEQK